MFKVEQVNGHKEGNTILAWILEDVHVPQRIQTVRCRGDQSFHPFKLTVREPMPYLSSAAGPSNLQGKWEVYTA